MKTQFARTFTVIASAAVFAGCTARVASFTQGSQAIVGSGGTPSASGVDGSIAIKDLSDTDARLLCSWLIEVWNYYSGSVIASPTPIGPPPNDVVSWPGYAPGPAVWCGTSGPENFGLMTEPLDIDGCLLNLRHSPCEGTVQALETCVGGFYAVASMPVGSHGADGGTAPVSDSTRCAEAWGDCATFVTAPSCSETVMKAPTCSVSSCGPCATELPVAANASCASLQSDAGGD